MKNATIVYNGMRYLFDSTLSIKAKGVMAIMVAYINKHKGSSEVFRLEDVRPFCCDGITAFKNAVNELKDHGYLTQSLVGNAYTPAMWEYVLKE